MWSINRFYYELELKLLWIFLLTLSLQAQERIIALSPSINEILFALGAGERVVGNTTFSRYPEAAKEIPKIGGYFQPNLEKILALKPTLAIMQQHNHKLEKQLSQLGINSKIVKMDTIEAIKETIVAIGNEVNQSKEAKLIVEKIEEHLEALKGIVKNKKILIVIGHNTSLVKQIFVAGQNLYFNDIIEASGNQNALQSSRKGQPILNQENIIATNPDIVILLAHSMKEKGLTSEDLISPWKKLPIKVAKSEQIYIIDKEYAGIPSDRLVLFLEDFRGILYDVSNK